MFWIAYLTILPQSMISAFTLPQFSYRIRTSISYHPPPPSPLAVTALSAFYNDFDDELGDDDDTIISSNDSGDLYASLRERRSSLEKSRNTEVWKEPPVETLAFPLPDDWVRRVAMDTTTAASSSCCNAIVGGASGSLYLIDISAEITAPEDVNESMILGTLKRVHEDRGEEDSPGTSARSRAIQALYGEFDGGGIIALAMKDNIVASAGREGGVHISLISEKAEKNRLKAMGKIHKMDSFVTCLAFDQAGRLWTGSFDDATIRAYDTDDDESNSGSSLVKSSDPKFTLQADSGIVSMFIADEIGCGVAATEKNGILLFSITDGTILAKWDPFDESDDEFARSAALVQNDPDPLAPPMPIPDPRDPTKEVTLVSGASWSVVVGGSAGSLYQRQINTLPEGGPVSSRQPFQEFSPIQKIAQEFQHSGSVVALASPGPQVLVSAGQDGSIRVWDCSYVQSHLDSGLECLYDEDGNPKPSLLFAMSGFKVWLGSLVVLNNNAKMLISDGADNSVVALIFKEVTD